MGKFALQLSGMPVRTLAVCCLLTLSACGSDSASLPAPSSAPIASSAPTRAAASVPEACKLLTADEVRTAAGWSNPTPHDTTVDRSYLSTCNLTDGDDAGRMIVVNVSVGGATHASSAEFAKSVGDNGGMLTHPAMPVDGYPVPVIEMDMGATHGMQARTPEAVELTVITSSAEVTRALFAKALGRLGQ